MPGTHVFPIHLPPLRERLEDLPLLAERLLSRLEPGKRVTLAEETMAILMRHDFPGNVRELRNIMERALIMTDGNTILPQHINLDNLKSGKPEIAADMPPKELVPLDLMEKRYLTWAEKNFHGDRKSLAEKLGMSERSLYRKLRKQD